MTAKTLAISIVVALLLAGCGNKGPLVLPPPPSSREMPAIDDVPPPLEDDADETDGADADDEEAGADEPAEYPVPSSGGL